MKKILLTALSLAVGLTTFAQRENINLRTWEFSHNKSSWQTVNIPHDWAICGPFDKKWDLQMVKIEQNNENYATEKSGRSGALPWLGKGYYKTTFQISDPKFAENKRHAILEFDGAMAEPTVYVNGKNAGYWAYGYNAFRLDITDLVKSGANTLEVSLQNLEESSRWYPGAGLYRPVHLVLVDDTALDPWATIYRTNHLSTKAEGNGLRSRTAVIHYETSVVRPQSGDSVEVEIVNHKGEREVIQRFATDENGRVKDSLFVSNAKLWSPESPYLYKIHSRIIREGKAIDEIVHHLGIRTIAIDSAGFKLNGVVRKIQGVCLHHDLGPLGAAINKAALIRQIKLMKDMGADAIRTSHNMPSQMQMDICDSLGMMVMAESFDMWVYPKCKNGYARFFKTWAEKDITNLIEGHRNHPSIIMWSIGNEIPEQTDKTVGKEWIMKLQNLCHQLDPTRPVTQGLDRVWGACESRNISLMDVAGLNYRTHLYSKAHDYARLGIVLGSETASTVSSRGVYKLPYMTTNYGVYPDGQCSSYDNEWCSWSNLPDVDFENMQDLPYTIGQFIWTGIDYLGEPTPYDEYWPSRSSYFGTCDLAGLPKDRYYLYRSVWNKHKHTIHIAPHWTWGDDMVGKNVPVQVYSDYDDAELFINGKSQGRIQKNHYINENESGNQITGMEQTNPNSDQWDAKYDTSHAPNLDRFRLRWLDTKYEPGELKVVVYDHDGKPAGEAVVRTAGEEAQLKLESDVDTLKADGNDLAYITVSMTDKDGTLCPDESDEIKVEVEGEGRFKAICNGDATSLEVFTQPKMKLFHGQLVITVQSTEKAGQMKVHVIREAHNEKDINGKKHTDPKIGSTIVINTVK